MKILAVIPARGGSKGIPRKNVRILHGKPLISYAIENALACNSITDVAISSDDEEILSIANGYPVTTIKRDETLAKDSVTLDPVIYDAMLKMEDLKKYQYDIIITMQPTSPLLQSETLQKAILKFISDDKDSYISVVNRAHLTWSKSDGVYSPNYVERLNRQKLPPLYFETGAFFISRRESVTMTDRLGANVSVFEISEDEAADIDSPIDWQLCENSLNKKRIVFRCDGHKMLGMGHIYHCLTLAYYLIGHEIMFVTRQDCIEGVLKLQSSFMPLTLINSDEDFFDFLNEWKPDIVVNDCLDTNADYIKKIKTIVNRVVTIEDMGDGGKYADAVINALYQVNLQDPNYFFGYKYNCLRDEFISTQPKEVSETVKNVLVIFGGTDPSNLTGKIYSVVKDLHEIYSDVGFTFILGLGYDPKAHNIVTNADYNITVLQDVKRVSEYMRKADIAFTSNGRTVFELASLGIPSIVLAQNERELLHTFAQMSNGFVNLGTGKDVSCDTIKNTFKWLADVPQIRKEMHDIMLHSDLKKGVKRVANIILGDD